MKKIILFAGLALVFALTSAPVSANMITNGSFEDPLVLDHSGTWQLFAADDVSGWSDANLIEIQTSLLFGDAADGNQYVELDSNSSDGNAWLTQTFDTVMGQYYTYSFAFSPRGGVVDNDLWAGIVSNGAWLDINFLSADGTGLTGTNWSYYSFTFLADSTSAYIAFMDAGADDSLGTFIDDVSVAPVPEPSTILLLGGGLLGLGWYGRKRKRA